uniref:Sugar transferase n=1 Tax=Schlesneria paludicola TaxID=360056 RepID=A0A7C2JZJ1_9PLAN
MTTGIEQRSKQVVSSQIIDAGTLDEVFAPYDGPYVHIKVLLDVAAAAALLLLLSPIMLVAAMAVKLTSRGPVFYRQPRLGREGQVFRVWKFRTMIDNAEAGTGPVWSTSGDPRITPIGKILRDTHIDEFPQLFNVLSGSMSLVGPRPERPQIAEELELEIPAYRHRLLVRPGITGFAQVRLPADSTLSGVRHKLAYDLYYIQHMGPLIDFKILLRTAINFVWSVSDVTITSVRLPRKDVVEKLLPFLMDEAGAHETFSLPAQRKPGELRRSYDKPLAEAKLVHHS